MCIIKKCVTINLNNYECKYNSIQKLHYLSIVLPTFFFSEVIIMIPRFTTIVTVLFLSYLGNLFYSIWVMVQPPSCTSEGLCLKSFLLRKPNLEVCFFFINISNLTFYYSYCNHFLAYHICCSAFKPSRTRSYICKQIPVTKL